MLHRISTSVHCMVMYGYVALVVLSQILLLYLLHTVDLPEGTTSDLSGVWFIYALMSYGLGTRSRTIAFVRFVRHSWLTVILSPIAGTVLWLITWRLLEARRDVLFGALSMEVSASAYMAYGLMITPGPLVVPIAWHALCCYVQNGEN